MTAMHFLEIIALSIGVVTGITGVVGIVWAVGRVRGVETSIELLNQANEGLRDANADLRVKLDSSERECAAAIARLEGQNQALLDGVGDKVAAAIASRLEHSLDAAVARIVDGIAQRSTDRERRYSTPPVDPPTT